MLALHDVAEERLTDVALGDVDDRVRLLAAAALLQSPRPLSEAALARLQMQPPYELPRPRLLISVRWPGGRVRHYADIHQCWTDAKAGSIPAQERGVATTVRPDDGSPGWADLYARAERAPVHDRG